MNSLFEPVGMVYELIFGLTLEKKAKNPFFRVPVHKAFLEGRFDKVPILIGFNAAEILLFAFGK